MWLVPRDTRGLTSRSPVPDVVREAKATVLLGLSGVPGTFDEEIVRAALANTPRPLVFPLSNPTAHSEALPEDLLRWTNGAAIVATDIDHAILERARSARYRDGELTGIPPQSRQQFFAPEGDEWVLRQPVRDQP